MTFWTEKEIFFLKENYERMNLRDIAKSLDRSHDSIRGAMKTNGFKKQHIYCQVCGNRCRTTSNVQRYCSVCSIIKSREHDRKRNFKRKKYKVRYDREYGRKNRDRISKRAKEYRQRPEVKIRLREYARRWDREEKRVEMRKKYYRKNKVVLNEKARIHRSKPEVKEHTRKHGIEYRLKNKEKLRKKQRNYRRTPKGKRNHLAETHRRMAHLKYKIGKISEKQIKQIFQRDKVCVYNSPICLVNKDLELEHIIPISNENGNSIFYNYVIACSLCNISKGKKDVFKWCEEKGIQVPEIVYENLNKLSKEIKIQKTIVSAAF